MAYTETWSCDECGKNRSDDVNHWRILNKISYRECNRGFAMTAWDSANWAGTHACGDECAFKMASRFMATGCFTAGPKGESNG